MIKYKVGQYEMTGGEIETFYKLFWFGPQDDGDLPSKHGMSLLIAKGLVIKNYHHQANEIEVIEPNYLSHKGMQLARAYYREKCRPEI